MAVKLEDLEKLKIEIPYKWREQSVTKYNATIVAYIDARQLFDKLDDVCGVGNWQSDFRLIDGKLYGGIGILVHNSDLNSSHWVWKWDVGTESMADKEKGETSDSLKRAGVQWGVGRFLYSLGIVKLKSAPHENKFKPADDNGNIIWDKDKLTEICMTAVKEGKLDRTKLKSNVNNTPTPSKPQDSNTASKPTQLPYLNNNTVDYEKVTKALKAKLATLDDVKKRFRLSTAMQQELEKLIKEN